MVDSNCIPVRVAVLRERQFRIGSSQLTVGIETRIKIRETLSENELQELSALVLDWFAKHSHTVAKLPV